MTEAAERDSSNCWEEGVTDHGPSRSWHRSLGGLSSVSAHLVSGHHFCLAPVLPHLLQQVHIV
jgi:hypothetical protein